MFQREESAPAKASAGAGAPIPCGSTGGGISVLDLLGSGQHLRVATAYRCVKLLCDSVAQLDMRHLRLRDGVFEEDTTSRLSYLLKVQPNPRQSAFEFWSRIVEDMACKGTAYAVPIYAGMDLERIAYVTPESVSYDSIAEEYAVQDSFFKVIGRFREEEILRFVWKTEPTGQRGVGVPDAASLAIGIAEAGDERQLNTFRKGTVKGIISNPPGEGTPGWGEYQDAELEKLAKSLSNDFNTDGVAAAKGRVAFTPLGISAADMQFLESRKFTVREICRFFGVHPSFVFDDTSNNYKSAEMANAAFLSNTLNPLLRRIEGELLRKLVPPTLAMKRKFEFDRAGLYACDLESKADYYAKMVGAGMLTPNEARALENRAEVPHGDRALVSANLRFLDEGAPNNPNDTDNGKGNPNP